MYVRETMNMVHARTIMAGVCATCLLLASVGCREETPLLQNATTNDRMTVYTTFYPTFYFASQIVGDLAQVVCPVPEGEDPIFWQPSRSTIVAYQQADLIVVNGAGYEKWIDAVSLPISRVVESAAPLSDRFLAYEDVAHNHGLKGEHSHAGTDGHTWVDPVNARTQANEILDAMIALMPEREAQLRENHAVLAGDLDRLDERMQAISPLLAEVSLFASHPAYNYLASRYRLTITNLDLDPEGPVSQLSLVADAMGIDTSRIVLWESSPSSALAEAVQAIGIQNVVFSPCESVTEHEQTQGATYISIMNANLDRLEAALRD